MFSGDTLFGDSLFGPRTERKSFTERALRRERKATRRAAGQGRRQAFRMGFEQLEARHMLSAGSIAGTIFHDVNGDGTQQAGELGIGGATVFLDTNRNGALDGGETATTTAADGSYGFTGLATGDYTVAQVLPTGWLQTAAGSPGVGRMGEVIHSVPLPAGVGTYGMAKASGVAWANGELFQVETDANVAARIWRVDPVSGNVLGSFNRPGNVLRLAFDGTNFWGTDTTTDTIVHFTTDGTVLHTFAAPGASPSGIAWDGSHLWVTDNPAGGNRQIVKLDVSDLNVAQLPTVSSFAAPTSTSGDLTFDGQHLWVINTTSGTDQQFLQIDRDTGEVLQAITPQLSEQYDALLRRDKQGRATGLTFDGHALWYTDYGVDGNAVAATGTGRIIRLDPGGDHRLATVADGQTTSGISFGNSQVATLSGRVFHDTNQNGVQDYGELGIAGRQVFLDHDGDGQLGTAETVAITDAAGDYQLTGRIGQTYSVAHVLPPVNWQQVSPATSHVVSVTSSGQVTAGLDFADYLNRLDPLASDWVTADGGAKSLYTGLVWNDLSGPYTIGTYSAAQTNAAADTRGGYDDWRVGNVDEAQQATINGLWQQYVLYGAPGNSQAYWTSTSTSGGAYTVRMMDSAGTVGVLSKSNSARLAMTRDTGMNLDDGAAGYSDTGWTLKSSGSANGGDYRQRAAGTGSHTATWTFTGLEIGATYKIDATWFAASGNASNAGYTIRDGGVLKGTVLVNQKVAANDYNAGGAWWEGLGTFTANSDTFTVTLSDQANGTVVADAVRIFKVYDSFSAPAPEIIVTPTSGLVTTEAGGTAAFSVALSVAPTADVTIAVSTSDASEGTPSTNVLTFTTANWSVPQIVTVTGIDDADLDGDVAYTIVLAAAVSADPGYNGLDVADVQVVNLNDEVSTKFYVVNDGTADATYEYAADGAPVENYSLANTAPRGAAATAAGDKLWVVDANKTVYVYDAAGNLQGSWTAGTIVRPEGITVHGNDVWIVDATNDRVYRYAGAATRLTGSQAAASNFKLKNGNGESRGITTDGTHLWVVNDASQNKVFKYTMTGSHVGTWTIASPNSTPTGITLDPSGASDDLWIVDSGTDMVYQYTGGKAWTSGTRAASATFNLAAGNTNPQGIADPPPPATPSDASVTSAVETTLAPRDTAGAHRAVAWGWLGQVRAQHEFAPSLASHQLTRHQLTSHQADGGRSDHGIDLAAAVLRELGYPSGDEDEGVASSTKPDNMWTAGRRRGLALAEALVDPNGDRLTEAWFEALLDEMQETKNAR
jgi:hypothetical protein